MRFNLLEVLTLAAPALACSRNHARDVPDVQEGGAESVANLRNRNPFDKAAHSESFTPIGKRQGVVPPGGGLGWVPRNKVGNVPYGTEIRSCYQKGVIALTFDDGPTSYTKDLLDLLARYNAKATFFINGNNNGIDQIYTCSTGYPALIKRMHAEGHQIASHTWSHKDLSTLDQATFNQEIYYNEQAINAITGWFPTYMRPPYLSCDATCQSRLNTLGYHVIQTDLDTLDWDNDAENEIQNSKNAFDNALNGKNPSQTSFLPLTHDNHFWTVYSLAEYMLQRMQREGYRGVTVGTCLNDPAGNWYRAGTGVTPCPVTPPPTGLETSPNGQCGILYTCNGLSNEYRCCSQYGWCGSTAEHCGAGCKAGYGQCS